LALIKGEIPALYSGVSQQPAAERNPSQLSEQENALATIPSGLQKRPPSEHVARVFSGQVNESYIHTYARDETEKYAIMVFDGDLRVFDLKDGSERLVGFPGGRDYLNAQSPQQDFVAVSVADTTFIVNRSVTPAMESTGASGVYKGAKQTFEDLPDDPNNDDVWEIGGDRFQNFTSYYVKRTGGVWVEWCKPGLQTTIDPTTMPHRLIRNADGSFTFEQIQWGQRLVGDIDLHALPSFIGKSIRDVFVWQNRLGFIADQNVVLSGTGDFYNFFRTTLTDLVATDRIDVAVSTNRVNILDHAVPFNQSTLLFSGQAQFSLNARETVSPTSISVDPMTTYECSPEVKPVQAGPNAFFVTPSGNHSAVREYYVNQQTVTNQANNVTAHVPRYIPKNIFQMAASTNFDMLVLLSSDTPNILYVYKYYWQGEQLKQQCWSKWSFDSAASIQAVDILRNYVYLLIQYPDGLYLETVNIESGVVAPGVDFQVFLDRRTAVTGSYSSTNDETSFALPYEVPVDDDTLRIVLGGDFSDGPGRLLAPEDYSRPDVWTVAVPGDWTAGESFVGKQFAARGQLSPIYARDNNGSLLVGRLQVRTLILYFYLTSYFKFRVHPQGRTISESSVIPSRLSDFDARTIGSDQLKVSRPSLETGQVRLPVFSRGDTVEIELINDSHLASHFLSAEWEGYYTARMKV